MYCSNLRKQQLFADENSEKYDNVGNFLLKFLLVHLQVLHIEDKKEMPGKGAAAQKVPGDWNDSF
ncbi:hypothetical protein I79_021323 [Cricetulus griseus]|uniref:Uncharacterized protein n=1 Tax=Cricetulus griseus TaxID=10029 RepID=G3ICD0_CRIGR|nr:hypothetical protein I79_021323 [Cricetulus griseus]